MIKITLIMGILIAFLICGVGSASEVVNPATGLPVPESAATISSIPHNSLQLHNCPALFDTSHGISFEYSPSGRYSDFVALLTGQGYSVAETTTGFLSEDLSQFKILIITTMSTYDSPYTPAEVAAIENFVDNGGKLLILADNAGCPNENINPVSQAFGTTTGLSTLVPLDMYISNLNVHPAFMGVSTVYLRAAGDLSAVAPSQTIAWTDAGEPVINVAEGNRVVIFGDQSLFSNDYIGNADNQQLASNLWNNVFCTSSPISSPEFPSIFLPATMIIGFLGAVLLIRRTKEH